MAVRFLVMAATLSSGCVLGAGGAVGYGTKRGLYAGGSVIGGVTAGQLAFELGGTTEKGAMTQFRVEGDFNRARIRWTEIESDRLYPGGRLGVGYAYTDGAGSLALLGGPDLSFSVNERYCVDSLISLGVEYRWIGGESQVVFAPRYETIYGLCLD